ncbi:MAG: 30S ribosomal protein S3, partial [Candidatus Aenigmarchaeota archaeon]|nr:30S ribosomal protein S3 [Candidatus Aenigmarchaeota archaeon]
RITVYANKPGMIIGKGGENINKISELLKEKFDFDNPRLDVQEIENPYKKASIVAEEIKNALERGINYRKMGNIMMSRVMESGAIGVEIRISGKMGSSRGRVQRFYNGYLKYSGDTAKKYVDYAVTSAITKAGSIGIKVRILKENPETNIVKIKEKVIEEKITKEDKFVCPYCGKIYEKERSLKIHIGQKHSADEVSTKTDEPKEAQLKSKDAVKESVEENKEIINKSSIDEQPAKKDESKKEEIPKDEKKTKKQSKKEKTKKKKDNNKKGEK